MFSLAYLTPTLILLTTYTYAATTKTYANAGKDWTEPACLPYGNKSLSPINILPTDIACDDAVFVDLSFAGASSPVASVVLAGDPATLRVRPASGAGALYLQNKAGTLLSYGLKEVVYRTPSEHGYNSTASVMEAQMSYTIDSIYVNYSSIKNVTVSVLFNQSTVDDDKLFSALVGALGKRDEDKLTPAALSTAFNITVNDLGTWDAGVNRPISFLTYNGTTTDATCNTGVMWVILEQQFTVSTTALATYQSVLNSATGVKTNAREVQNFYDVKVYRGGVICNDYFVRFAGFVFVYALLLIFVLKMLH